MGGKCSKCGRKRRLSFDCKVPQNDGHARKMSSAKRIRYYWNHFRAGNLDLLCIYCNSSKATRDKEYLRKKKIEVDFVCRTSILMLCGQLMEN